MKLSKVFHGGQHDRAQRLLVRVYLHGAAAILRKAREGEQQRSMEQRRRAS